MAAPVPGTVVVPADVKFASGVVIRPGDKLVVGFAGHVDMATAHEIKQRLSELLPGVEAVLIDQCSSLAVYRDEPGGIIQLSQRLTEDEVQALRERGVIDDKGKSTGDRIAGYFDRDAERRRQARIDEQADHFCALIDSVERAKVLTYAEPQQQDGAQQQ